MDFSLGPTEKLRRSLLSRAGYLVFAFVVILNVAFNALTEVNISWQSFLRLSTDCLLYLGSVYVTFCAMADTARRDARNKSAYTEARERCRRRAEEAKPHRRFLSGYLAARISEERIERQRSCLEAAGLCYDDFSRRYARMTWRELKASGLTRPQRRAVRAAARSRPMRYGGDILLPTEAPRHRREILLSPGRQLARRYTAALLPTTIFSLFSAQIIFAVQSNCDPKTVFVQCLLRVGLLSWTALRGYAVGERTILCDSVAYLEEKADLLEAFLQWIGENGNVAGATAEVNVRDTAEVNVKDTAGKTAGKPAGTLTEAAAYATIKSKEPPYGGTPRAERSSGERRA